MSDRRRRDPLTHVIRARVTQVTKREVEAERRAEEAGGRPVSESDVVRDLVNEGLAARAARRNR